MTSILVTGSSRGIGKAIAARLAGRGAQVIGQSTRAWPAGADPSGVETLAANFSDPAAPSMLWAEALESAHGEIDVLVNNAGVFKPAPLESSDIAWLDAWEETLRIDLTAAAQLSRLAVRHWQKRAASGRIVHIASRAGHRGDGPGHWHYAAAKGGMLAMHKTIARGYAAQGILSFAIAPGFTDTAMAGDYLESRGGAGLLADIPLGRVAEPDEIAVIAEFCALDAPASMTGAVLDANGASHVR